MTLAVERDVKQPINLNLNLQIDGQIIESQVERTSLSKILRSYCVNFDHSVKKLFRFHYLQV